MKIPALLAVGISLTFASCGNNEPALSGDPQQLSGVTASDTLQLSNWISFHEDGTAFTYSSTVTWPIITQDIRDRGLVMAYMKNPATQAWQALPYSHTADGCSRAINFDINTGLVNITCDGYDLSGSPGVSSMNGLITIRLVAASASARAAHPGVDWTNYEEVVALLDKKE